MPAAGRKPTDGPKHGRTPLTHDWVDVADKPYRGKAPALPKSRPFVNKLGLVFELPLAEETAQWWADVSSMPHCVLWSPTDWRFAIGTALVADMLFHGDRQAAGELRLRERTMGTTLDARRDLRIRYCDPGEVNGKPDGRAAARSPKSSKVAKVANLDERRRRITNAS